MASSFLLYVCTVFKSSFSLKEFGTFLIQFLNERAVSDRIGEVGEDRLNTGFIKTHAHEPVTVISFHPPPWHVRTFTAIVFHDAVQATQPHIWTAIKAKANSSEQAKMLIMHNHYASHNLSVSHTNRIKPRIRIRRTGRIRQIKKESGSRDG